MIPEQEYPGYVTRTPATPPRSAGEVRAFQDNERPTRGRLSGGNLSTFVDMSGVDPWNPNGNPLSVQDIESEIRARGLLAARNRQRMAEIEEAAAMRPDPMEEAIEARQKDLAYERLLPAGSKSRITAVGPMGTFGATGTYDLERDMDGPTIGEDMPYRQKGMLATLQETTKQGILADRQRATMRELMKFQEDLAEGVTKHLRERGIAPGSEEERQIREQAKDAFRTYMQGLGLATGKTPDTLYKEDPMMDFAR